MIVSSSRPFLGVHRSVLGQSWRERLSSAQALQALAMRQTLNISDMLARVLAARHIVADNVSDHLAPKLRDLMPEPYLLQDMEAAVERLAYAIQRKEQIAIFGDYDVDGATSCALLADFLEACGCPVRVHIPDRLTEGYGPNAKILSDLQAAGAGLLVSVDCGTHSHEAFEQATKRGLDCVVLDHHQASESLPPVRALVNPNRLDDISGLGYLCAVGVVHIFLVALKRHLRQKNFWQASQPPDLLSGLDLVALGTMADMVPLIGLNRPFVFQGLHVMRLRQRLGLRTLMDQVGLQGPLQPHHLNFILGPRLNAGGRIGNSAVSTQLLRTRHLEEATRLCQELIHLNAERHGLESQTLQEAEAFIGDPESFQAFLVVSANHWHPGLMGLIAARLKERFQRPTFAIAFKGDLGVGSGRSLSGVDIGHIIRKAVAEKILQKGGGHKMAAGITVERQKLKALQDFLEAEGAESVASTRSTLHLPIDGAVTSSGTNISFVQSLEAAGPFGVGNPEPIFAFPAHRLVYVREVGRGHIKMRLRDSSGKDLDAMAFRAGSTPLGKFLFEQIHHSAHFAGTLTVNHWGGGSSPQLHVVDAAVIE